MGRYLIGWIADLWVRWKAAETGGKNDPDDAGSHLIEDEEKWPRHQLASLHGDFSERTDNGYPVDNWIRLCWTSGKTGSVRWWLNWAHTCHLSKSWTGSSQ
jgi:hypothetical protein